MSDACARRSTPAEEDWTDVAADLSPSSCACCSSPRCLALVGVGGRLLRDAQPTSCRRRASIAYAMYNGIASNLYVGHHRRHASAETLLGFVFGLRAGLHARHGCRALAHGGILPLSHHHHVSGDAEGGAGPSHSRLVRTGSHLQGHQRGARRLLPTDGQYHRRPALGG